MGGEEGGGERGKVEGEGRGGRGKRREREEEGEGEGNSYNSLAAVPPVGQAA